MTPLESLKFALRCSHLAFTSDELREHFAKNDQPFAPERLETHIPAEQAEEWLVAIEALEAEAQKQHHRR